MADTSIAKSLFGGFNDARKAFMGRTKTPPVRSRQADQNSGSNGDADSATDSIKNIFNFFTKEFSSLNDNQKEVKQTVSDKINSYKKLNDGNDCDNFLNFFASLPEGEREGLTEKNIAEAFNTGNLNTKEGIADFVKSKAPEAWNKAAVNTGHTDLKVNVSDDTPELTDESNDTERPSKRRKTEETDSEDNGADDTPNLNQAYNNMSPEDKQKFNDLAGKYGFNSPQQMLDAIENNTNNQLSQDELNKAQLESQNKLNESKKSLNEAWNNNMKSGQEALDNYQQAKLDHAQKTIGADMKHIGDAGGLLTGTAQQLTKQSKLGDLMNSLQKQRDDAETERKYQERSKSSQNDWKNTGLGG